MLIINGLGSQATAKLGVVRNVTKYPVRKESLVTGDWGAAVMVGASGNSVSTQCRDFQALYYTSTLTVVIGQRRDSPKSADNAYFGGNLP